MKTLASEGLTLAMDLGPAHVPRDGSWDTDFVRSEPEVSPRSPPQQRCRHLLVFQRTEEETGFYGSLLFLKSHTGRRGM